MSYPGIKTKYYYCGKFQDKKKRTIECIEELRFDKFNEIIFNYTCISINFSNY